MMSSKIIKHKILNKFIESNATSPKQGSKEWIEARVNVFGGSEIAALLNLCEYTDVKTLIARKCDLIPFYGNIYTKWGQLFEYITKKYTEIVFNTTIYETGSVKGKQKGQSYSPDGLGVVKLQYEDDEKCSEDKNKKFDYFITLFEFKAPATKIPINIIPSNYVPQILLGLNTITITKICIFVNNMYRICSFSQFCKNDISYNLKFHRTDDKRTSKERHILQNLKKYIAKGIIYFMIDDINGYREQCDCSISDSESDSEIKLLDQIDQFELELESEFDNDNVKDKNETGKNIWENALFGKIIDFGNLTETEITILFDLFSKQIIKVFYSDMVLDENEIKNIDFVNVQDMNHIHFKENDEKNIIQKHNEFIKDNSKDLNIIYDDQKKKCLTNSKPILLGFLPWKLLVSNILTQDNDDKNFMNKVDEKIMMYLPILESLNNVSIDKRAEKFLSYFPDNNKYIDRILKSKLSV